jgi:hypothetical protein
MSLHFRKCTVKEKSLRSGNAGSQVQVEIFNRSGGRVQMDVFNLEIRGQRIICGGLKQFLI